MAAASHHRARTPGRPVTRWSLGRGEDGSTLLLALVFVTVVMSLTVVLLAFAKAGNTAVHAYKVERTRRYAVDGALQSAIQMAAKNPAIGRSTAPASCDMLFLVQGSPRQVVGGSYLVVTCAATPSTVSGSSTTGNVVGGQQTARDVTFNVGCYRNGPAVKNKIDCSSGTLVSTLASARVRYEIDYSVTDQTQWAIVPKIVTWEVRN